MASVAPVLLVGLVLGPLHAKTRTWNATAFRDQLTGQVVRDSGVTRGIVSLAGSGSGKQRVLVRADLLISPQSLLSTAFQMEYLPSGALCRGNVTKVAAYSFEATCRLPRGQTRYVHAEWHASGDDPGRRHRQRSPLTRHPTANGFDHASVPSRPTTSTRPHFSNSGGSNLAATIDPSSARPTTDPRQCISSGCAFTRQPSQRPERSVTERAGDVRTSTWPSSRTSIPWISAPVEL